MPVLGRFSCGENRDQAPGAVNQLKFDRKFAQFFERRALQQLVALYDDENVKFVRREAARHFFISTEFIGVGAEQLAQ